MVTLNYIKHKPVGSNASTIDLKLEESMYQPAQPEDEDDEEALQTVTHQEHANPPWLPFFLDSVELAETLPSVDFLLP